MKNTIVYENFLKRKTLFRILFLFFLILSIYFLLPQSEVSADCTCDCGTDKKPSIYGSCKWDLCVETYGCCGCYGWGDCNGSCYRVYYNPNGGSCQYTQWTVQQKDTVSPGSCTRSGYTLTGFSREYGCGNLNTSSGAVSNVTCETKIRANWSLACTCGTCDPYNSPGCPTNYTRTNTGCSSTNISCTKYNSCGSSCGTVSGTCYLLRRTVNFYASTGGYISGTTPQQVCHGSNSAYVEAKPNSGYLFTNWSDGVTSAYRRVTSVTSNTSRTAYFCNNSSCNPDCSAWSWTSESGSYGHYSDSGCTNDCGTLATVSCYCTSQCTLPNCPSGTSTTGEGDLYDTSATSCTNECGQSRTRYCRYDCEQASCSDLQSDVNWLDSCPSSNPDDCRETTQEIAIEGAAPGCPTSETKTCFIENTRPQLVSVSTQPQGDVLGYESTTHSGTQLNNPLKVTAQYSDADGQEDIEAVYLWWSSSESKDLFTTPNRIADAIEGLTGETQNNENFGFMVTRNDLGNWDKVYIPHIGVGDTAWIEAGTTGDTTTILGKEGKLLSRIQVLNLTNIDANIVSLEVNVEFLSSEVNGTGVEEIIPKDYNIWGLVNDTVGFLPFEEDLVIEDSEDEFWQDSLTDWSIELDRPILVNSLSIENLSETDVSITFSVRDDETNLSRIRLDACRNSNEKPKELKVKENDGTERLYDLDYCYNFDWGTSNPTDIDMEAGYDLLGIDPIEPNSNTYVVDGITDEVIIDIGENENGSVTFYLTFMDDAGNWFQDNEILRLGDWAVVKDGLVYGGRGVSSSTRKLKEASIWGDGLILKSEPYNFEYDKIDISDVVLVGGKDATTNVLRFMERYSTNRSFKVAKYSGVFIDSIYSDLMNAYKNKQEELSDKKEATVVDTISGNLSSLVSGGTPDDIFFIEGTGDITIDTDFLCDAKGLIAVSGDITIKPDFLNDTVSNACIILASGDIIIQEGQNKTGTPVDYDVIQAFIIAAGEIRIEADGNSNGLLIEGGLTAFTPTTDSSAIFNQRNILLEYRHNYPVLAVKHNAKYGLLSRQLFGTQASMFQVDIGFKPY